MRIFHLKNDPQIISLPTRLQQEQTMVAGIILFKKATSLAFHESSLYEFATLIHTLKYSRSYKQPHFMSTNRNTTAMIALLVRNLDSLLSFEAVVKILAVHESSESRNMKLAQL